MVSPATRLMQVTSGFLVRGQ